MKVLTQTKYLIGIDEVGRGPLAGPVTVGVVKVKVKNIPIIKKKLLGITDSKQLSEQKRIEFVSILKDLQQEGLISFTTSSVSAALIDTCGISWAIQTALNRALRRLQPTSLKTQVFLDGGLRAPEVYEQETIIKGDASNFLIATASVLAKVTRDEKMKRYAQRYPNYRLEKHKGYGTKEHRDLIQCYGVSDIHRKSWIKY
jgi:ribonuclease HII